MKQAAWTLGVLLAASVARAQAPGGPEFKVNSYVTGFQLNPSIAARADGSLLVGWTQFAMPSPPPVFARAFDGFSIPRAPEFVISPSGSQEFFSSIAVTPGGFVMVWEDHQSQAPFANQVRGRLLDAAGNALGAEFVVSDNRLDEGSRVGAAADGSFVATWISQSSSGLDVFGRRFSAAAAPLGPPFRVNTYTTGDQGGLNPPPALAVAGDGSFAVVWTSLGQDGTTSGVYGQGFDSAGAPRGGEFRIGSTSAAQSDGSVAFAEDGSLRVAWTDLPATGTVQVHARAFSASGAPLGAEQSVSSGGRPIESAPLVAPVAGGRHVVVWKQSAPVLSRLRGRMLDAFGVPVGLEFAVSSRGESAFTQGPGVAVSGDGDGGFALAWVTYAGDAGAPSVQDVYARRFLALAPAPAAVDGAGDGVLEPGESVAVAPAWSNFKPTTVAALASTALAFEGPGGPLYTIVDGQATFGDVAPGATASCAATADCYALGVSAPPTRPAAHWDAALTEQLSTGQQHLRFLHVGDSFADVPRSTPFYRFVETLLHRGVTSGCGGARFCPLDATTRAQMAVFTLTADEGAGFRPFGCASPSRFADVPATDPFCPWVEELARRGVVGGCGGTAFCPGQPVTRAETAVFVLRTLDPLLVPPACGTPRFSDVPPSSPFCRWVEELARRGATAGCGGGRYCPDEPTTREQMAALLTVAFGLTLYGV